MQGAKDRLAAFQLINQAALRQGDPLALALYSEIADGAEPLATRADLAHVDFSASGVERGIANVRSAAFARTSRRETAAMGSPAASQRPLAAASPARMPVNDPGP